MQLIFCSLAHSSASVVCLITNWTDQRRGETGRIMRCAVRTGRQVTDRQLPTLQRKSSLRKRPLRTDGDDSSCRATPFTVRLLGWNCTHAQTLDSSHTNYKLRTFSPLQNVKVGSQGHPASFLRAPGNISLGIRRPTREGDQALRCSLVFNNEQVYTTCLSGRNGQMYRFWSYVALL